MVEKEEIHNVTDILKRAKKAIMNGDSVELKELSNMTIHTASTAQDTDSILIAIIMYSLSKIIERPEFKGKKGCDKFCQFAEKEIGQALNALEYEDHEKFLKSLENVQKYVNKISGEMKIYIKDVFEKAKINKATKIYEHGISLGKTAELLGVSVWELTSYAGQKEIKDISLIRTIDAKERINIAMSMFR
jgi:predicted HTH domain antitoxin